MDYIFISLVLLISFYIAVRVAISHNVSVLFISILYVYHFTFTIIYYIIIPDGFDSSIYYNWGSRTAGLALSHNNFWPGTKFIIFLVSSLYSIVPISRFSFFCLFGQFGLFGLLFLYLSIKPLLNVQEKRWTILIIFMPGLSFWSSALGKDALIFLPLCYSLYIFSQYKFNILKLGFTVALIFMVRPHIAYIFMIALCLSVILTHKSVSTVNRIFLFFSVLLICTLTFPMVMTYVGISDVSIESIISHIDERAGYNQIGSTGFDIHELNLPMKLFTYLFRPLFFDAPGLLGLGVSFENLCYLIMCTSFVRLDFLRFLIDSRYFPVYFSVSFSLGVLLVLGLTTANLGIAIRQKTMFFPFIIYLLIYFDYWRTQSYRSPASNDRLKAAPGSRLRLHGATITSRASRVPHSGSARSA